MLLLINILLAVLWIFFWGDLSLYNLAAGFLLGYAVLYLFTRVKDPTLLRDAYGQRIRDLVCFGWYFTRQLFISNWETAREILTPGIGVSPRIIRYDVTGMSDLRITVLSNAITLTPGTLVVDLRDEFPEAEDGQRGDRTLYVHCLYAKDEHEAYKDLHRLRLVMDRLLFRRHRRRKGEARIATPRRNWGRKRRRRPNSAVQVKEAAS